MNVSYINYKGQPVYYQLNSYGKWLTRLDLDLEVDKGHGLLLTLPQSRLLLSPFENFRLRVLHMPR